MNKLKYHFITHWRFDAPAERVWALYQDADSMPQWWPSVKRFEVVGPDKQLELGRQIKATVHGLIGDLSFTLEVTELRNGKLLKMKSAGDLEGEGTFTLDEDRSGTHTTCQWDVATTGWLMNLLGLVFKPVFSWNHNRVMAKGYKAIRIKLTNLDHCDTRLP